jgi:hypothetical protein
MALIRLSTGIGHPDDLIAASHKHSHYARIELAAQFRPCRVWLRFANLSFESGN